VNCVRNITSAAYKNVESVRCDVSSAVRVVTRRDESAVQRHYHKLGHVSELCLSSASACADSSHFYQRLQLVDSTPVVKEFPGSTLGPAAS
jgi:hypothetical protein